MIPEIGNSAIQDSSEALDDTTGVVVNAQAFVNVWWNSQILRRPQDSILWSLANAPCGCHPEASEGPCIQLN